MDLKQMRERAAARLAELIAQRSTQTDALAALRGRVDQGDATITTESVDAAIAARGATDTAIDTVRSEIADLDREIARDAEIDALALETRGAAARPAYDKVARVVSEERAYSPHAERGFVRLDQAGRAEWRHGAKPGATFERDVIGAFQGDWEAQERLQRHQREERVERAEYLQRAVGTGAFAGLTVPQYLTDFYAPKAAAGRPLADAIAAGPGGHLLPESGMTVEISRITTGSSASSQSSENAAVTEQDMDDTQLSIPVITAAGQQTISRQALDRSTGVEPIALDDLFRRVATDIDSNLINRASIGLTNVATAVTYTDASPTAGELYPKLLEAQSGVEGALLDQSTGEMIAVMHSRRWYWMQSQVSANRPFVGQPGLSSDNGAVVLASSYGRGVRGVLPNGCVIIVDNNVATNLGAGTNEDEIYLGDRGEFHLWEDPSAPMFIRAEQAKAANLGMLLVAYSYYAFTHARQAHSRKIGGTGLVTPVFA